MNYPILAISGDFNLFKSNLEYHPIGVYMASGFYTGGNFNQSIYIGGSNNLSQRIQFEHISDLNSGIHPNPVFQSAWNKHEQRNFVWWLLEYCEIQNYVQREQYFLDLYRPFADEKNGFNIAKNAAAPFLGRKHSKESKLLMSNRAKGKQKSQETKEKLRASRLGKKASQETIAKMKEVKRKPTTQETKDKLRSLFKGRKRPIGAGTKSKDFDLISPNGEKIHGNNICNFLKEHSMNRSCFYKLLNGKKDNYKGWTLPKQEVILL